MIYRTSPIFSLIPSLIPSLISTPSSCHHHPHLQAHAQSQALANPLPPSPFSYRSSSPVAAACPVVVTNICFLGLFRPSFSWNLDFVFSPYSAWAETFFRTGPQPNVWSIEPGQALRSLNFSIYSGFLSFILSPIPSSFWNTIEHSRVFKIF